MYYSQALSARQAFTQFHTVIFDLARGWSKHFQKHSVALRYQDALFVICHRVDLSPDDFQPFLESPAERL